LDYYTVATVIIIRRGRKKRRIQCSESLLLCFQCSERLSQVKEERKKDIKQLVEEKARRKA